jgi:nicotinamidase/pyrazinamidase
MESVMDGDALVPRCGDALLLVDVQCDFLPGGSLAVRDGDRVLAPINDCIALFGRQRLPVYASRDWHPAVHCSFRDQGGPWPPHCIAGSAGAQFSPDLRLPGDATIVSKATAADRDAYSAFDGTDLAPALRAAGVARLFVAGLATDWCVLRTVVDALGAGFGVVVLRDAVAAVDVQPGDGERALEQMRSLGATLGDAQAVAASTSRASARSASENSTG